MAYLNFDEIKNANPIDKVMETLGLELIKSGKGYRGKCPSCESDNDRNLVITPDKGVYYCFADGNGGDQIQLVSHIKGIGVKEAAQSLAGTPDTTKKKKKENRPSDGFKPLDYLQHDHDAVEAVGFSADDAKALGVGYAPRGLMRGTVAVPVRLEDGKLVGYLGITEAKLPNNWNL
ncbi:CHC2 zinc finger domain-containing protein [Alphaproteobacteria bacterium]|nr:CHC2 zinc finger domain-containing protein [Alphaproteobacteria bacterium]